MIDSLFTCFDSASSDGIFTFTIPAKHVAWRHPDLPSNRMAAVRCLVGAAFSDQQMLATRMTFVKSALYEILFRERQSEAGDWVISLNLLKMLSLPGWDPVAELAEVRKFYAHIREFMEAKPSHISAVQVSNSKDSKSKVYANLLCHRRGPEDRHSSEDLVATQQLKDLVAASPVMQYYLYQFALTLGKKGPCYSANVTERQLYPYSEGPYQVWFRNKCNAKAKR